MKKSELKKIIHECLCEHMDNMKLESMRKSHSKLIVESADTDSEDLATEFLDSSKICKDSFEDIVTCIDNFGDAEAGIQDYYDADKFIKEEIPNAAAWYTLWDSDAFGAAWNILVFTSDKKCYGVWGEARGYWKFWVVENIDIVKEVLSEFAETHPEYSGYTPSA